MLKEVFEYNIAKDNTKTKMDTMLPQMVEELNRMQDHKPMYMRYNLDTRARLEHFFAQCYVEVGGSAFRLEEDLHYSVRGLITAGFDYYRTTAQKADKEKIKEALNDGRATKPSDYAMKDILSNAPSNAIQAIKDLVQDYINFCLNLLPKTNGAINQKTNTTEIEKTLGIESKKKFDSKKAYSPIELIESFTEYQSYPTIQLAFKHAAISLSQGANYEIPYSTESHKAFILIAQAIANHIVGKRANKNANPIEIANKVYSSDGKNNRNNPYDITKANQEQDGYRFRGRGIKQLTHRYNYADFQSYYNKHYPNDTKDFLNNEEHRKALLDNGKIALLSAVWFWNHTGCYKIADKQTSNNANEIVKQITKKVNGGTNGLDKRTKQYARIKNTNIFKDF